MAKLWLKSRVCGAAVLLSAVAQATPAGPKQTGPPPPLAITPPATTTQSALPDTPAPNAEIMLAATGTPDAQGVYRIGKEVRRPVVIYMVNPEFTEKARKKKFSGDVHLSLVVGRDGLPQNVRVEKGVGLGLDEKAVEAVRQYRFKPAMKGDTPVPVMILVAVNFQIF